MNGAENTTVYSIDHRLIQRYSRDRRGAASRRRIKVVGFEGEGVKGEVVANKKSKRGKKVCLKNGFLPSTGEGGGQQGVSAGQFQGGAWAA